MGCMLMGLSGPLPPAAAAAAANGYDGSRPGSSSGSYDKMLDPRIRQQCEKIGLQLLVIRRHQDPVSASLKRVGYQAGSGTRDRGRNSQHESRSTWGNLAAQDRIRELEREKERDRMGGGAHGSLSSSLANANANMHGPGIGKKRGRHVNGQGLGHASRGSIDSQTTIAPEDRTGDGSEGDGTAPTRPSSSSNHPTMMGNSAEDRLSAALRSLWDKPLGGALAVE